MKSIFKYNEEHHKVYEIFIYGADTERKVFFAADSFEEGIYSYQEIPFDEVSEGYHLVMNSNLRTGWKESKQ